MVHENNQDTSIRISRARTQLKYTRLYLLNRGMIRKHNHKNRCYLATPIKSYNTCMIITVGLKALFESNLKKFDIKFMNSSQSAFRSPNFATVKLFLLSMNNSAWFLTNMSFARIFLRSEKKKCSLSCFLQTYSHANSK